MNKLNFDIIYFIFGSLDFLSKIRFRSTSKYNYLLEIHDFFNIGKKYLKLLNDNILLNYPFITHLNASFNPNITNINHLKKLIKLDASEDSGIDDKGITDLNLVLLDASDNPKITNINHMDKLIELYAWGNYGISDFGIKNLYNIKILDVNYNSKINDINHMNNLIELYARGPKCGITDKGIQNLNKIKILDTNYNSNIININHMQNLVELYAI
jgi:hypothetical protein